MAERIVRLGLIYPTGGGEFEYYQLAEETDYRIRPIVVAARLYGDDFDHDPPALSRTGQPESLCLTARSFLPLSPDSVMWACTSGSFIDGRAHAERQAEALTETTGVPASSTSLAFAHASQALGLTKVSLLGSYIEPTVQAFVGFLGEFGLGLEGVVALGAPGGRDAFQFSRDKMLEAARSVDTPESQAILIPDTAMACLHLVEPLEAELGKPVLTANQVTIWEGLRLAKALEPLAGYGRLFAETA